EKEIVGIGVTGKADNKNSRAVVIDSFAVRVIIVPKHRSDGDIRARDGSVGRTSIFRVEDTDPIRHSLPPIENSAIWRLGNSDDRPSIADGYWNVGYSRIALQISYGKLCLVIADIRIGERWSRSGGIGRAIAQEAPRE